MKKDFRPFTFLYITLFILGLFVPVSGLFAQVNQSEMENLGPVEFINYVGPYTRIDTRSQISDLGYSLGVMVRNGQTNAGSLGRYFVIHSVSPEEDGKMDADIFGLGVDVGVDHIRNLRLIIQGYLEAAYEYSPGDAALLAEYVTIYNAVYRGDVNYFGSRYKTPVMEHITPEQAGLSIRFDEWPGRTLMIIPLGMVRSGPLSSIDTTPLIDSKVTEQLREEPDLGLDTRKDMVDLLERQAEEAAEEAAIQREAIREEEERLARERQEAQEQARQAQEQARQAEEQVRQAQTPPQRQEAQEQVRQAEEQVRQAEERQEEVERQEQELEQRREEAEQTEQYAEQKADEAQEERNRIAEDQQSQAAEPQAEDPAGILGAAILTPLSSLGRIVTIDPANGQELKRSDVTTVNARSLTVVNNRIIAIAGEVRANAAIRLAEFDRDTLEMITQGEDDISPTSLIWVRGSDLYAIVAGEEDNLYLARFNVDLVQQARSAAAVHSFAAISFVDDYLVTQRADGAALLLDPQDLTETY